MKKTKMTLVSAAALLMLATMFQSAKPEEVMTKQDGMYVEMRPSGRILS